VLYKIKTDFLPSPHNHMKYLLVSDSEGGGEVTWMGARAVCSLNVANYRLSSQSVIYGVRDE
jgi:hypothetical protein